MLEEVLVLELKETILERVDLSKDIDDEEINKIIDICILEKSDKNYISVSEKIRLKKILFNSIRRLDILSTLLQDDSITEIMINGYNNIFIEKEGRIRKLDEKFSDNIKLLDVIQQIIGGCNRIVNEAIPIADGRLSDGSRVNVVLSPISLDGAVMTIRKFPKEAYDMKKLIELDSISCEVAKILSYFVRAGYNIFISGGTGSGKTTLLNALTNYISQDERIITIEDSAELRIEGISNLVRLEARNANLDGDNQISIRDLIKSALRMRPTRIIVGEVRDGAALDMISAMNTGHDGSLSTGHANSSIDMLSRLETMILMAVDMPIVAIRKQIASAVDIIIHVGRLRDRTRRVLEIREVLEYKDGDICTQLLYNFVETRECNGRIVGKLVSQHELINVEKLKRENLYEEYMRDRGHGN